MTETPDQNEKTDNRIAAYSTWVSNLRAGKPVPPLRAEGLDSIGRLGQELELLAGVLNRREHELRQLFDLVQTVEQGVLIEDVLNYIFNGFTNVIPFERIGCTFLSEDGTRVSAYWARSNLGPMQISAGYSQPLAGSSLEQILRTNQPRIINDLEAYLKAKPGSDSTRRIVTEGGRSSLTCPLIARDRPVGFLFFTSGKKDTYRELHQAIFRQIAAQVSLVIDKSRLYQRLIESNRRLVEDGRQLELAASHDALTGVLNRGAIMRILEAAVTEAATSGKTVGVIMADIDHFKRINDSLGHAAGDEALKEFTRRLKSALRQDDRLGRYGGEEFLIVVVGASSDAMRNTAERLRAIVAASPFELGAARQTITASFGTSVSEAAKCTPPSLVAAADRALYVAKNAGRNRVAEA